MNARMEIDPTRRNEGTARIGEGVPAVMPVRLGFRTVFDRPGSHECSDEIASIVVVERSGWNRAKVLVSREAFDHAANLLTDFRFPVVRFMCRVESRRLIGDQLAQAFGSDQEVRTQHEHIGELRRLLQESIAGGTPDTTIGDAELLRRTFRSGHDESIRRIFEAGDLLLEALERFVPVAIGCSFAAFQKEGWVHMVNSARRAGVSEDSLAKLQTKITSLEAAETRFRSRQ